MIEITVGKNDAGKRIDNFLFKLLPDCPKPLIFKVFRKKDIKINGKRVDISQILREGDTVTAYLPSDIVITKPTKSSPEYDFLKAGKQLNIVYEDENIIIANKPAGLICHSDKNIFGDTLIDRVKRYLYEKNEYDPQNEQSFSPALCNRLDRNTCGLVIAAKNAESLRVINRLIKSREISKYYFALVSGRMPKNNDTLKAFITKNEEKNISTVSEKEGNSEIITEYKVVEYKNGISLLEINLITGRTHQIRAHLANIGNPILGDPKYALSAPKNKKYPYQALAAYKIHFDFKSDAGILSYLNGQEIITNDIWFL